MQRLGGFHGDLLQEPFFSIQLLLGSIPFQLLFGAHQFE